MRTNIVQIPEIIRENHRKVELTSDIMFFNQIPFMVTISCGQTFGTIQFIKTRSALNLLKSIKKVVNVYQGSHFNITDLYMDREFEPLRDPLKNDDVTKES